MKCPKCGTTQPASEQCRSCGIYFEKYKKYLEKKNAPTAAPIKTAKDPVSVAKKYRFLAPLTICILVVIYAFNDLPEQSSDDTPAQQRRDLAPALTQYESTLVAQQEASSRLLQQHQENSQKLLEQHQMGIQQRLEEAEAIEAATTQEVPLNAYKQRNPFSPYNSYEEERAAAAERMEELQAKARARGRFWSVSDAKICAHEWSRYDTNQSCLDACNYNYFDIRMHGSACGYCFEDWPEPRCPRPTPEELGETSSQ